jgi:hypothetical protein
MTDTIKVKKRLIEQNLFNLTTDNPDNLIGYLRRVVLRLEVLLFTRKKASSMKRADLGVMCKKAPKSVCTCISTVPDSLSPTPRTF